MMYLGGLDGQPHYVAVSWCDGLEVYGQSYATRHAAGVC